MDLISFRVFTSRSQDDEDAISLIGINVDKWNYLFDFIAIREQSEESAESFMELLQNYLNTQSLLIITQNSSSTFQLLFDQFGININKSNVFELNVIFFTFYFNAVLIKWKSYNLI